MLLVRRRLHVIESNQEPLPLEVSGFVRNCVQMASLPGEGNALSPPREAVILGHSRRKRTWQLFEEIISA